MSPIRYEDAFNATNPSQTDEQRDQSARSIMAGVAANDAYWNSRSDLEALKARAEGHGIVVRGPDEGEESPTVSGTETGTVEGTATDEPATALGSGESAPGGGGFAPTVPPSPDNPTEAVAKLRAQVAELGGTPEA